MTEGISEMMKCNGPIGERAWLERSAKGEGGKHESRWEIWMVLIEDGVSGAVPTPISFVRFCSCLCSESDAWRAFSRMEKKKKRILLVEHYPLYCWTICDSPLAAGTRLHSITFTVYKKINICSEVWYSRFSRWKYIKLLCESHCKQ